MARPYPVKNILQDIFCPYILQDLQSLARLARFLQDKDPFFLQDKIYLARCFYWVSSQGAYRLEIISARSFGVGAYNL